MITEGEKRVLEARVLELQEAIRTHEQRVSVDNIVGTDKALWACAASQTPTVEAP